MEQNLSAKSDVSLEVLEEPPYVRRIQTPILLAILLVLLLAVSSPFPSLAQTVSKMTIDIVVVVGLYVFIGNSGILSFGQISFMSVGAYSFAWISCCTLPALKPFSFPGLPIFLQESAFPSPVGILAAAAIAGGVALIAGGILMRLSGTAASIATFALLAAQYALFKNWTDVTGGTTSISNVPVFMGPLIGTVMAIGIIVVAWMHQQSRFGLMLRAARDEQTASRASGINVWAVRTFAFTLSGVIVGVGGAMQAGFLGVISVDSFYLGATFLTLAMLIVGGTRSLSGAVVGVVAITAITEILRRFEVGLTIGDLTLALPRGLQEVGLGMIMILILLFRPTGIMKGRELTAA